MGQINDPQYLPVLPSATLRASHPPLSEFTRKG